MTTGIANNWSNLNVVGRVDLDALTVNGVEVTGGPGPTGATGPTGPTGATGPTGPTGATGSVAGANTQIQYNNAGAFGATGALTWDGTSLATSGNLKFTGTGSRIISDFSNATLANRTAFQTSTTNGQTNILAIPNGTATSSGVYYLNSSAAANCAYASIAMSISQTLIDSNKTGTGTAVPIAISCNGFGILQGTTAGNIVLGPQTTALSTTATDRFLHLQSCAGTPTGVPTAITGHTPLVFDSTNNLLYYHTASGWKTPVLPQASGSIVTVSDLVAALITAGVLTA